MYEEYKSLIIERRGRALWVTMNNPPLNPMTLEMHQELSRIFRQINLDRETKVVVLTGSDRGFSAGGNIKDMKAKIGDTNYHFEFLSEGSAIVLGLVDLEKPIIARINGHAMGLGASLALLCDITIANEKAKIGDPHVKMGLVAGDGGALIWPQLIGSARAKEYLLTGKPLTATEAASIGLINYALPADEMEAKVAEFVEYFENAPRIAIQNTKRAINLLLRQHATAVADAHLGLEAHSVFSRDHHEAVDAFLEERAPRFE